MKGKKKQSKKKLKDSWVFFNITIPGDTIMCFGYCYVKMVKFMTGLFLKYSTLDNLCCMRKLIYSWIHLYSFLVYAGTDKTRWQNRYPKNEFMLTASLFGWTPTGKEIQFRQIHSCFYSHISVVTKLPCTTSEMNIFRNQTGKHHAGQRNS